VPFSVAGSWGQGERSPSTRKSACLSLLPAPVTLLRQRPGKEKLGREPFRQLRKSARFGVIFFA